MGFSSVLLGIIQRSLPPSELWFAFITTICCLLFFAAVSDPESFYSTFSFVFRLIPTSWRTHVRKSIEYLNEGDHRLKSLQRNGTGEGNPDVDISNGQLYAELVQRMRVRYVLPFILAGAAAKSPSTINQRYVGA